MGDSIGKWEGDTLVVDSVGFNDRRGWIMTHPHTRICTLWSAYAAQQRHIDNRRYD